MTIKYVTVTHLVLMALSFAFPVVLVGASKLGMKPRAPAEEAS